MATHKAPLSPLSIAQLCEITGRGFRTVKKRLEKLEPEKTDGKTIYYNTKDALHLIFGHDDGEGKRLDGQYELARLNKLRADHLELDLQVKRGELVNAKEFLQKYANLVATFRARCLSLSRRLVPEIRNADNEREAIVIFEKEMKEVLSELSRYDGGTDSEGSEGSGAAADDDGE